MSSDARVVVRSDFNASNFANYLTNNDRMPSVTVRVDPSMKGPGLLLQRAGDEHARGEVWVVWTQPHYVSQAFAEVLEGAEPNLARILDQVDEFAEAIVATARMPRAILIPSWVLPHGHRGFGLLAMRHQAGPANLLARMNLRLSERLSSYATVFVLDAQRWLQAAGADAYNPRLWHLAKIPFGNAVFQTAASETQAALRALAGDARKLVLVDLDHTLWGGIVGDDGWENLRVGGHDPIGEAYAQFQEQLKSLTRRGIILGIVSKNEEAVALEALAKHPEMRLRTDDFAAWRINWSDKAENVAAVAAELNLGLQSVVFLDDNPSERARVRASLPEVLVPELPGSPLLFPAALAGLDCFDVAAVTAEDRSRHASYQAGRARAMAQTRLGSIDEWLQTLAVKVRVGELTNGNLPRVAQLLNKTNQMNLSTRRLTAAELLEWAGRQSHYLWAFRVADKFEDAGLTGIISVAVEHEEARIVDFVLSCRVMGRQIEEAMLHQAVEHARSLGLKTLSAEYIPTAKNAPTLRFFERSGLENGDGHRFRWDLTRPYARPQHLQVEVGGDE